MSGSQARLCSAVTVLLVVLAASSVAAQPNVDQLAKRLTSSEDFRVRTQAALALGSTSDKRAIGPLCRGLDDASTTVRAAAAAGLGKLKLGGAECLKRRLKEETSAAVKATIQKAMKDVAGGTGPGVEAEPLISEATKVYVAIDKIADNTGRSEKEIDGLVRTAMTTSAKSLDGYVVAPKDETVVQAKKRLSKHKQVRAFLLSPRVEAPRYADGNLTIKVEVAIFTYPGRALKGSIPIKLTQQGVSGEDPGSENELIQMAAERALEKFSQNVERID